MVDVITALFAAVCLCLIGEVVRIITPGLRRLLVPGAVIGGLLALVLGPQVIAWGEAAWVNRGFEQLSQFPALFINVVFAALMLGKPIGRFSGIWRRALPQIVMGHIYAWGQYVIGLAVILFVLSPLMGVDRLAGATIAIGFQGGHGTAAGLQGTFHKLGFVDGKTIAYAMATFGIIAGTIGGPLIATVLSRRHAITDDSEAPRGEEISGGKDRSERKEQPVEFSPLTGKLSLHLALIGTVILVGYGIQQGMIWTETSLRGSDVDQIYTSYIPLFSIVLIAGFATQLLLQLTKLAATFERPIIENISAFALDMVIVSALASLDLAVVGDYWLTILVLCIAGATWNLSVFFGLGPRVYPKPWYPYGLGDLGGGTATTASGLLLIRAADPKNVTQARQAYSEKQPLYEPFMGGGLVTAFALPVIASLGATISLAITAVILAAWLNVAVVLMKRS